MVKVDEIPLPARDIFNYIIHAKFCQHKRHMKVIWGGYGCFAKVSLSK